MISVLSPAKKLDFEPIARSLSQTAPLLSGDTRALLGTAKKLTSRELKSLMKLSDALATLNFQRFQNFSPRPPKRDTKQAALAFNGDTYVGLQASSFSDADFAFAQDHVLILSGLYGLLRPLDAIQPYRLEMGTKLATNRGSDLYQFWGTKLTAKLNTIARKHNHRELINLASSEYFSAVDRRTLNIPVVTCVFKEGSGGAAKVIGFAAKRARGMMARFIVKNRLTSSEQLKEFGETGYRFVQKESNQDSLVFHRRR